MKRINGVPYRRFKSATGKKYWVALSQEEILARDLYWLGVLVITTLCFLGFCWAGGFLG